MSCFASPSKPSRIVDDHAETDPKNLQGEPDRFVVQGVHMLLEGELQRPWKAGEERLSRLVLIGRKLDAAALQAGFEACAA